MTFSCAKPEAATRRRAGKTRNFMMLKIILDIMLNTSLKRYLTKD
jgi:hypothetical protein